MGEGIGEKEGGGGDRTVWYVCIVYTYTIPVVATQHSLVLERMMG